MANLRGFDANQVPPSSTNDYGPLPAGQYVAVIIDSVMRENRAGTGSYLQLTFEIVEGAHKGRRIWARLNLEHPNPVAVSIARAELASICRAVGVMTPTDSVELHDIPLVIHVVCRQRPDTADTVNEIKGYSAKPAPSATAGKPGGGTSLPPWKR